MSAAPGAPRRTARRSAKSAPAGANPRAQAGPARGAADRHLAETLASLADGFVVFDREWRYTFVNAAAARMLNTTPEAMLGQVVWELFPEATQMAVHAHFHRAVAEQVTVQFEQYAPGRGWYELRCQPTGEGLAVYFSDITARKQTEEALQRSDQRLATLAAATFEGIAITEAGRYVDVNEQLARMLGATREELIGRLLVDFVAPEDREKVRANIQAEREVRSEKVMLRKDGSRFIADSHGQTVTLGQRRLRFTAIRDITQLKQAEQEAQRLSQELAQLNAVLEHKVQERTTKLEEALSELERFSYALAHDLRAPLRAMQGFSQLLLHECPGQLQARHQDFLKRIMTASARLDLLITDALQYHKTVAAEFQLQPVDAATLLHDMVQSYPQLQPPLAQVSIQEPMPWVLGNEAALTQSFSNVLNNAVKFVPPGRMPAIRVWAERVRREECGVPNEESLEGRVSSDTEPAPRTTPPACHSAFRTPHSAFIRIWFEDNGIGIAREHQEQIWQMFERVQQDYEGTGIGLALVRKLVERMKGQVGVESELGQGSRFWIELQAAENGAAQTAAIQ